MFTAWTRMTEADAFKAFCEMRWPEGKPICPACGCNHVYDLSTRRRYKCKQCRVQFSPTTGTPFAYRKLSYVAIMRGREALYAGHPATTISELIGCQYRSAWLLSHRVLASEIAPENAS